jgi:integrase
LAKAEKRRLSKRAVEAIRTPSTGVTDVWDDEVPGYHVRVWPSGRRSYRVKYRAAGRQRIATVGEHGAFTAEQARGKAVAIWNAVREGRDPLDEKVAAARAALEKRRRGLTLADLVERWLAEGRDAAPSKREISWATDARKLRRHMVPLLGTVPVRDLSKGDIEKAQRQIAAGATAVNEKTGFRGRAIVRGGRGVARSAVMSLSACLSWAVDQEIIALNPCTRVKKYAQGKRERFLSEQEAARLLDTLALMEKQGALSDVFADMTRLLLLTGARKSEIQYLEWSEVDLARGLISLPQERSKTGEKHIPLSAPARSLLADRPRLNDSAFVFPSPIDPTKPADGLQKAWERIRVRAGLEGVRIHDMRHSYASFAAAGGASLVLIGKALGHTQSATTQRYAHLGADPVRDLAEQIGATIMNAQKTEGQRGEGKIMPLNGKRGRRGKPS